MGHRLTGPPEPPGYKKTSAPLKRPTLPPPRLRRSKPQPVLEDRAGEVPASHPHHPSNAGRAIVDASDRQARPTPTPRQKANTSRPAVPLS
jgi:hypothetical protein